MVFLLFFFPRPVAWLFADKFVIERLLVVSLMLVFFIGCAFWVFLSQVVMFIFSSVPRLDWVLSCVNSMLNDVRLEMNLRCGPDE